MKIDRGLARPRQGKTPNKAWLWKSRNPCAGASKDGVIWEPARKAVQAGGGKPELKDSPGGSFQTISGGAMSQPLPTSYKTELDRGEPFYQHPLYISFHIMERTENPK